MANVNFEGDAHSLSTISDDFYGKQFYFSTCLISRSVNHHTHQHIIRVDPLLALFVSWAHFGLDRVKQNIPYFV